MGKLVNIYTSIKNPLEDEELLKKIVLEYSKSDRTYSGGISTLYKKLVQQNQTKDSSIIKLEDEETFFVKIYNQWIENICNLDEAHIQYLESSNGMDAKKMQQYLRNFGKVSSMEDIRRLKESTLFNKEINDLEVQNGWEHIDSKNISVMAKGIGLVKHRLYISCQNQDMWKLAQLFENKCEDQQLPFYFKLGVAAERDDKMVIYADTDNLANYINILQEIAQENPKIIQRCGKPPVLTGKIDEWIGIGDEPPKKNGKNSSYNSIRTRIFEDSIEEVLLSDIAEFKGKDVIYEGKKIKFDELFLKQATQTIIDNLERNKDDKTTPLSKYGLIEKDLTNIRFKKYIKSHFRKEIQKGLNKLEENKKDKELQSASSVVQTIFSIPTRDNKEIKINLDDMDAIIKAMVHIMQEIDSNFIDKIKSKIQEKCVQNGIDDTFVFQKGSKEKFEQVDLAQLKQQGDNNSKQQPSEKENHKAENQEEKKGTDEVKDEITINNVDIVKMINQDILKQKIKLPNGVEIPVKQYIQEVVAPHIPSSGKFILKSNGGEIPAKQFIEEVVMSVGQEKYNGDINALLEDMTISDTGTISTSTNSKEKIPIGQELKQEHVMSQETSERREHKSFAERAKKNSEPLDNKQRKAGRSMTDRMTTMINVKRSISQSRITKSETQQQIEEMTNNVKVRKLLQKQNSGAFLTEEEKRFIEQHIRENTEAQIRFMNQQNKKRNRGIEM